MKKNIIFYTFWGVLISVMLCIVCLPKAEYTNAERRKLAKLPKLSVEKVLDKTYMSELETYLLDHFPLRNQLRTVKAYWAYEILRQKENNGIYIVDDVAAKLEYSLNESSIIKAAEKMTKLQNLYFQNAEVYYTIVPDKNYFLAAQNGYPAMDYELLKDLLKEQLTSMIYIDIMDTLSIDDYYKTDTHWRQECILDTADQILKNMGEAESDIKENYNCIASKITPFYGVYYGQSALSLPAEDLIYLQNDVTECAKVISVENSDMKTVYTPELIKLDSYDVFLGGAQAVIKIENSLNQNGKRLIMFRDSFGSSIAPLLLEKYEEMVLIDTRYIKPELIADYVDFDSDKDTKILFLYNTLLLNSSNVLK